MRTVFADTNYWIASANPQDQWTEAAREAKDGLGDVLIVTTDEVLTEFLDSLSGGGPRVRRSAVEVAREILDDPDIRVIEQSRESFLRGLELYRQRTDKDYSLVDCVSMNAIRVEGLEEVLTSDDHFAEEGFTVLMRS